jgi:hypothetical protein
MATENYVYFPCETATLPARFGGGLMETGTGGGNATARTITMRNLAKALSYPKNGTNSFFRYGTVAGVQWARTTQDIYDAISSELRTSETAGNTTTMPVGFSIDGTTALFMPKIRRVNVFMVGDSISAGVGTTGGFADAPMVQASAILDTNVSINSLDDASRSYMGDKWAFHNLANGGSSWDNTNEGSPANPFETGYPYTMKTIFNQLVRSLNLGISNKTILCIWLGTNDLNYGTTDTPTVDATILWARIIEQMARIRREFSSEIPILSGTILRRTSNSVLNNKINDINTMIMTNYASVGFDDYIPYHTSHPSFHPITGNDADATVFSVGGTNIHPNTVGAGYLAQALATKLTAVATAKGWL